MMRFWLLLSLPAFLIAVTGSKNPATAQSAAANTTAPVYTADGKLVFPPNYREWIYLTTASIWTTVRQSTWRNIPCLTTFSSTRRPIRLLWPPVNA